LDFESGKSTKFIFEMQGEKKYQMVGIFSMIIACLNKMQPASGFYSIFVFAV
jgi:hypothetical protein